MNVIGASTTITVSILAMVFVLKEIRDKMKMLETWNEELEDKVEASVEALLQSEEKLKRSRLITIYSLAAACEARDTDTGDHIHRIRFYCEALARKMGLSEDLVQELSHFSTLHDIGKVHIPDRILLKPGKLTDEEWEIMKTHTVKGERILAGGEEFRTGMQIARWHHENWDGSGYPDGLKGEYIPISARIVKLADVLDALLMSRCYRPIPFTLEQAAETVVAMKGKELDPDVVEAFEHLFQQNAFKKIREDLPLLLKGIPLADILSPDEG
ncbi:MAG: HD domain-containing phosphohydrolase [Candidatus Brocadiales bacterium]|nr:HD domain-containing phosphohydrolase [Candidatus Brocadiales bacterium]